MARPAAEDDVLDGARSQQRIAGKMIVAKNHIAAAEMLSAIDLKS